MSSLLLGISKKPNGVRPISVGNVLYRVLVGKTVANRMFNVSEQIFAPIQFGVGVKGGAEKIITGVSMIARDILSNSNSTSILFAVDGLNAFNTISRRAIANFLHEYKDLQSVIPLFHYSYGSADSRNPTSNESVQISNLSIFQSQHESG